MRYPRALNIWTLLLVTYSVLLASGSLYPYVAGSDTRSLDVSFLWAAWPSAITRMDILTNVFVYVPFGIVATRTFFGRHYGLADWLVICLLGAAFSTTMECLQWFLPNRVASNVDIIANSVGVALGAAVAPVFSSRSRFFTWFVALRRYWFRPGWIVNLGLILLVLWVLAQFSLQTPGLVAGSLHGGFTPFWESHGANFKAGVALLFALDIAAASLFTAILLRAHQHLAIRTLGFTVGALLLKFLAAALLIKLAFFTRLLSLEVLLGLGFGASVALSLVYFRARPPPYPLLASVLCSLVLAKLLQGSPFLTATGQTPDLGIQPELLFNIGGIAYLVAETWPYLALGCTLALWEREN